MMEIEKYVQMIGIPLVLIGILIHLIYRHFKKRPK
jgi:hypothetical protein